MRNILSSIAPGAACPRRGDTPTSRRAASGHSVAGSLLVLITLLLWNPRTSDAQLSGVSYTLSPVAERFFWHDNAGLDGGTAFGGMVGLGFGEHLELSGLYVRGDAETDFSALSGLSEGFADAFSEISTRDVTISRYGAELRANLAGGGTLIPFITLGTGIIRFEPTDLDESRRIYLTGGAGVRFSAEGRYTLTLQAQNLNYRYNPALALLSDEDLDELGLNADNFDLTRVSNWGLRAGLKIYLGGRQPGELTAVDMAFREQFGGGFSAMSLPVEPFVGRVDFDESLSFQESEQVAGVTTGLDLGPYAGIRAIYWRAFEDELLSDFDKLQSIGGELRLRLSEQTNGVEPFLTVGGGYVDVGDGYTAEGDVQPEDQPYASVGAGLVLPVQGALRIHGSIRGLFMSNESTADVAAPADVSTSWMYTAGIAFAFGAPDDERPPVIRRDAGMQDAREEAAPLRDPSPRDQDPEVTAALDRLNAKLDSLSTLVAETRAEAETGRSERPDSADDGDVRRPADSGERQTTAEEAFQESVSLPIPRTGELYVRYGDGTGVAGPANQRPVIIAPAARDTVVQVSGARGATQTTTVPAGGGLSASEISALVQEEIREGFRRRRSAEGDLADLQSIRRLEARIDDRFDALERRVERQVERQVEAFEARQAPATVVVPSERGTPLAEETTVIANEPAYGYVLLGQAFTGGGAFMGTILGLGPEQFAIGARGIFRPAEGGDVRYLPELALGFGGKLSFNLNLNAAFPIETRALSPFQPYVGAGLGLFGYGNLSDLEATLNLLTGVSLDRSLGTFFFEYGALDFFDRNRIIAGYRVRL